LYQASIQSKIAVLASCRVRKERWRSSSFSSVAWLQGGRRLSTTIFSQTFRRYARAAGVTARKRVTRTRSSTRGVQKPDRVRHERC